MFLFMVLFVSCDSETIHIQDMEGKVVRLTLSSPELTTSRVMSRTEAGTGTENYIDNIRCFFYKSSDGNDVAATYVYPHPIEVEDTYAGTGISVQIPLTSKAYNLLFPEGTTQCGIYVIANLPSDVTIDDNTSINSLKALEVTAEEFAAEGVEKDGSITFSQPVSFVMDGDATIKLNGDALSGNVPLTRSAAKIGLFVNVDKEITDTNGATWESKPTGMLIRIHNGVKNGLIDGLADDGTSTYPNPRDYYTSAPLGDGTRIFVQSNNGQGNNVYEHHPFYSYPSEWKNSDENETYLELIVPWKKTKNADGTTTTNTEFEDCFYQIPLNVEGKELLRNTYYKINLTVGMLGSFTPNEPVVLAPSSYVVVDWGTGGVSAKFEKFRYLVVDQNFVEMDNVNSINIGMATSHDISYQILSITKPDYSSENIGTTTIYTYNETTQSESGNSDAFTFTPNSPIATDCNVLTFTHNLDNDNLSDNYDYVPYTIRAKVWHEDKPEYNEIIEYKQYPAMYIEGIKNNNHSNVFIYNNSNQNGSWDDLVELTSGGNHNPNMYIINVSAFIGNTDYIIGDSRSTDYISGQSLGIGDDINGKVLEYYYPTRTDNINIIAPKFRVASSHGKCAGPITSLDNAEKRCAAYQEAGYPAGRWRVPTAAEFGYIAYLSGKGYIPHLYTVGSYYWTATGKYKYEDGSVQGPNNNGTNPYVRCVYDEWYWTDKCNENTFTWGDKEITW